MSHDPKPDSFPEPLPAPQLPNLPVSPDDPFQPAWEDPTPATAPPDSEPVPERQAEEVNPEVEPQFDNGGS